MDAQHDSSDSDDDAITYRTISVEHQSSKLYLVVLPEKGGKKEKQWVFTRSLEYFLWGTETNSSNLLHALDDLELGASVRHLQASTMEQYGMTKGQLGSVMSLFNEW